MGKIADAKKMRILNAAREVFAKKGYSSVTMKDIVEASEISRGGLYLYFSSVEEVFETLIKMDEMGNEGISGYKITKDSSATDILLLFLKAQKEEIVTGRNGLSMAYYEYCYSKKDEMGKEVKEQYSKWAMVVQKIIEIGIESGEFECMYPHLEAQNFLTAIEGMKIMFQTSGITEEEVDQNLAYLVSRIAVD